MTVWTFVVVAATRLVLEAQSPLPLTFRARLQHTNHQVRRLAVSILDCRRNPHEHRALLKAATDTEMKVRWQAVLRLGHCHQPKALSAMKQALRDPAHLVRIAAIFGLVRYRGKLPYLLLQKALQDRHPAVRIYATVGLVKKGYRRSFALLQRGISSWPSPQKLLALTAIENLRASRAAPFVLRALRDSEIDVRQRSLLTLARLVPLLGSKKWRYLRTLRQALRRRKAALRGTAAGVLAALRDSQGQQHFRRLLLHGPPQTALYAIKALLAIGNRSALRPLLRATSSAFPNVRSAARFAIYRIRSKQNSSP